MNKSVESSLVPGNSSPLGRLQQQRSLADSDGNSAPGATPVPATPTPVATPTKSNVTISVMASQDWIKSSEQVLAGKFEAQTGIHLDFQIIPSDQYFNVLKTKLNSGQGVDLFLGQAGKSDMKLTYNAPVNAVDLTNEAWAKTIDPVVADQSSLDGKLYGAEVWDVVGANYWVISYNMDIFKANNLSVPKTFAEFEARLRDPQGEGHHADLRADLGWLAPGPLVPSVGAQVNVLEPRPQRQPQCQQGHLRRQCQLHHGDDAVQRPVPEGLLRN